jgi:hypothetical protein
MSDNPRRFRRPREIIEKLPGGFVVDIEGSRSVENAQTVASIILRIWPDVALAVAVAWRPDMEEVDQ